MIQDPWRRAWPAWIQTRTVIARIAPVIAASARLPASAAKTVPVWWSFLRNWLSWITPMTARISGSRKLARTGRTCNCR